MIYETKRNITIQPSGKIYIGLVKNTKMKLNNQRITYTKNCLEFLHYKCVTPDDKDFRIYQGEHNNLPEMIDANFNDGFLNNWNWIMKVVEAIEKLKFNVRITIACVTIENAFDNDYSNLKPIYKFHSMEGEFETKKEAVVEAINQFLIWYEQNK